jgi:hypothetical protein
MAKGIHLPFDWQVVIGEGLGGGLQGNFAAPNPVQQAQSATSGITSTYDFLSRLSQPNLWLRVAEVGIGGILIYVGLRSMFPAEVAAVTGPVKTAAKVIPK